MRIVISNASGRPIYEQIAGQIRAAIMAGELAEGERLPSIRALARDLRVSVITTTRAYADLAAEGFVTNVQGKGSYVLARDAELVREHVLGEVERHLSAAIDAARAGRLSDAEIRASVEALLTADEGSDSRSPGPTHAPDEQSDHGHPGEDR